VAVPAAKQGLVQVEGVAAPAAEQGPAQVEAGSAISSSHRFDDSDVQRPAGKGSLYRGRKGSG